MKRNQQIAIPILIVVATISVFSLAAQQQATQPPTTTKIEGSITTALNTGVAGMPTFTLKTEEGKEYVIHLGPMRDQEGNVFFAKVGETITVTATAGHPMAGLNMLHAAEITSAGQTFRLPTGWMPGMMGQYYGPGTMGPGMMGQYYGRGTMGPGMMGQYYGRGTTWCPGMMGPW